MATISILNHLDIRDKQLARAFVNALEEAKSDKETNKLKQNNLSKKVKEMDRAQIQTIFGKC
jgi:Mn-containing catalase